MNEILLKTIIGIICFGAGYISRAYFQKTKSSNQEDDGDGLASKPKISEGSSKVKTSGEAKKDEGTLSVPASGDTKQGGINYQDDTKLQLERSASLPADNQPLSYENKRIRVGKNEKFCKFC